MTITAKVTYSTRYTQHGPLTDYLRWTGRLPVMFLNRLFFSGGWAGILVLNLVNSAFVLLLAKLVMLHTRTEGQPWPFAAGFSVFVFLVWFSTDVFGEAVIWKSGQIQYFWACILALVCISPVFQFAIWGRDFEPSRRIMVLYLVGCLLGGLWLEHQSAVSCCLRYFDRVACLHVLRRPSRSATKPLDWAAVLVFGCSDLDCCPWQLRARRGPWR